MQRGLGWCSSAAPELLLGQQHNKVAGTSGQKQQGCHTGGSYNSHFSETGLDYPASWRAGFGHQAETLPALPLAGIDEQVLPRRVASYLAFLRGHSGVWGREDAGLDSGEMLTPLLFHSWNPERDQQ